MTAEWVIEQSEAQFQESLVDYAVSQGWEWMHVPRSFTKGYWRTQLRGTMAKGWPDLVLVRGGTILFVELKAARGIIREDQRRVLGLVGGMVWTPADWPLIVEVLRAR